MSAIAGIVWGHQREENELMTERQNQRVKNQDQESPRKPYTNPQLIRHGTVMELTRGPIASDFFTGSIITDTGTEPI